MAHEVGRGNPAIAIVDDSSVRNHLVRDFAALGEFEIPVDQLVRLLLIELDARLHLHGCAVFTVVNLDLGHALDALQQLGDVGLAVLSRHAFDLQIVGRCDLLGFRCRHFGFFLWGLLVVRRRGLLRLSAARAECEYQRRAGENQFAVHRYPLPTSSQSTSVVAS